MNKYSSSAPEIQLFFDSENHTPDITPSAVKARRQALESAVQGDQFSVDRFTAIAEIYETLDPPAASYYRNEFTAALEDDEPLFARYWFQCMDMAIMRKRAGN